MIRFLLAGLVALMTLAANPALAEMKIVEVTSPKGIKAWLVEEHSIPFVAMNFGFQGGTVLDAPGKRGVSNLMMALIEEGAGDLDSQGFAAAQEALAASFEFNIYGDSAVVRAQFLSENQGDAVELLRKALIETRFDQDAITRVKAQVLSNIASNTTDPQHLASEAFDRATWGDHPYGSDDNGTEASVTALTRDDILAAKAAILVRDRAFVGVVGDITPEVLGPLLDHLLGDLPLATVPLPPPGTYGLKPGTTVIDFPIPQSIAIFGHQGIKLDDPDYFAAYILNEAFGGGTFSSRLMEEVREKRGLTYGIGTYLLPMDYGELLLGQVQSANDKMAETLKVTREQWALLAENGLTEEELANTKTFLTGSYPLRFDGNANIAAQLTGMQMNGFPIDYIQTRNARVEAVTLDDIKRVAKRLFRPEDLAIVVVGQPVGVE